MTAKSEINGRTVLFKEGQWVFEDTGEPVPNPTRVEENASMTCMCGPTEACELCFEENKTTEIKTDIIAPLPQPGQFMYSTNADGPGSPLVCDVCGAVFSDKNVKLGDECVSGSCREGALGHFIFPPEGYPLPYPWDPDAEMSSGTEEMDAKYSEGKDEQSVQEPQMVYCISCGQPLITAIQPGFPGQRMMCMNPGGPGACYRVGLVTLISNATPLAQSVETTEDEETMEPDAPVHCERCGWQGQDKDTVGIATHNCPQCGSTWKVTEGPLPADWNPHKEAEDPETMKPEHPPCENCGHSIGNHTITPGAPRCGCLTEGCECDWTWDARYGTRPPRCSVKHANGADIRQCYLSSGHEGTHQYANEPAPRDDSAKGPGTPLGESGVTDEPEHDPDGRR